MSDHPLQNLQSSHREQIAHALIQLRGDLADGFFLREKLYTRDDSCLAGNTHHYWIRLGLDPDPNRVFPEFIADSLPDPLAHWLNSQLEHKIIRRLPSEYSTLIKIPFSVELGKVAEVRTAKTAWAIEHRLPSMTPYAIFHLEINRLLKTIGVDIPPPRDFEFEPLFARHNRNAIAKARARFPEVWDEQRGHYVLDSRGTHFAKLLVSELRGQGLLSSSSEFVDVGSGIGTNVIAVNHFSDAQATGIERHAGVLQIAHSMTRRLASMGQIDSRRIEFILGNALDSQVANLAQYDVFYLYSPLGMWEIDVDTIVDAAKVGAVMVCNRLPVRNRETTESLANVAGLFAFRKITNGEGKGR